MKRIFSIVAIVFYLLFGLTFLTLPFVDEALKAGHASLFCLLCAILCFSVVYVVGINIE